MCFVLELSNLTPNPMYGTLAVDPTFGGEASVIALHSQFRVIIVSL